MTMGFTHKRCQSWGSIRRGGGWFALFVSILFGYCRESIDAVEEPHPSPTKAPKIAFVSNRESSSYVFQLFIMDGDGTDVKRLTHDSSNYFCPRFSPDGLRILYYSQNGVEDEVYIIDINGEHCINLTNSPGNDRLPQFSPDGSKIAFVSDRDGNEEIYVMNADGSDQRRLTTSSAADLCPQFSPDSRKVLFYSTIYDPYNFDNPETYDIYTIECDGTNLAQLTPDSAYFHFSAPEDSPSVLDAMPRYSPDGSTIVFQNYSRPSFFISLISSDGGSGINLVYQSGVDFAPFFYPGGSQILFRSHRDGDFDLYRMGLYEGAPQLRVTDDVGHTMFGDFADDGSAMLYFSNIDEERYEYYHIYRADADGRNRVKLTQGKFTDYFPDFQPNR
jgi:Tol biopolymer transport system component